MNLRSRSVFRAVAVILLLLTGAELFACEVIAPDRCESFGFPSSDPNSLGDDNCICCCTHILIAQPITLEACAGAIAMVDDLAPVVPESEPLSIYHPPRA